MQYTAPQMNSDAFHCPICSTYAHMTWSDVFAQSFGPMNLRVGKCQRCGRKTLWKMMPDGSGFMLDPAQSGLPPPHQDMPNACRSDYEEARAIAAKSPRGAAALLRLAVQKLCISLGQPGKNINDDIKGLVAAGLPIDAQQALDVLRVAGNNAVHPGELDLNSNPELVAASFGLINLIVDQQISQKKRVSELFAALPAGAKQAIAKRDGAAAPQPAAPGS